MVCNSTDYLAIIFYTEMYLCYMYLCCDPIAGDKAFCVQLLCKCTATGGWAAYGRSSWYGHFCLAPMRWRVHMQCRWKQPSVYVNRVSHPMALKPTYAYCHTTVSQQQWPQKWPNRLVFNLLLAKFCCTWRKCWERGNTSDFPAAHLCLAVEECGRTRRPQCPSVLAEDLFVEDDKRLNNACLVGVVHQWGQGHRGTCGFGPHQRGAKDYAQIAGAHLVLLLQFRHPETEG